MKAVNSLKKTVNSTKSVEIDLNSFIGKNHTELEKALGFTHYLETQDRFLTKEKVNTEILVEALFRFVGNQNQMLKAVKTNDGTILEIFDITLEDAKKNTLLFVKDKGRFYDENLCISYSILGKNFYAFAHGVLMFSASETNAQKMAKILDEYSIEYFEPHAIEDIMFIPPVTTTTKDAPAISPRMPGRNEACYCGSGKKYKKCCLNKGP